MFANLRSYLVELDEPLSPVMRRIPICNVKNSSETWICDALVGDAYTFRMIFKNHEPLFHYGRYCYS